MSGLAGQHNLRIVGQPDPALPSAAVRVFLELPTGRVELVEALSPDAFITDRDITRAEYYQIRGTLRQMVDCALTWSYPRGLVSP